MITTTFLLTSAALLLSAQPAPDVLELEVMTFNIRYGTANDRHNAWEKRKDMVVRMLEETSPDIVGLQECLDFQAKYLEEHLEDYKWLGIGRDADRTGEMTAILYRSDLFTPVQSGDFWLSETPEEPGSVGWDASLPRIATWAKFHHKDSGQTFYAFNTHFDHRGARSRDEAAKLLSKRLQEMSEGLPFFLTGDFNALAQDSEAWTTFHEAGLGDAWLDAETTEGPSTTWGGFSAPKPGDNRRIDWILVQEDVAVMRCATVTYSEEQRYPSDHFPVLCTLRLPASERGN